MNHRDERAAPMRTLPAQPQQMLQPPVDTDTPPSQPLLAVLKDGGHERTLAGALKDRVRRFAAILGKLVEKALRTTRAMLLLPTH
jgi:hypothetical protein